ncbi:MAG TPA: hypothetical protein VE547_05245 [Mycobacteriales bacterium]|nr:hypothetical protein [Mycobacteriales bacterium]
MSSTDPADLVIHLPLSRARRAARPLVDDPAAAAAAAAALAAGALVGHPSGPVYALTARPDAPTARALNRLTGRPPREPGSVTTTPLRLPALLDWSRLPAPLAAAPVLGLLDALLGLGPVGVRGPAAPGVPDHLTRVDAGVRTLLVVMPGPGCPSADFLARALRAAGTDLLATAIAGRCRALPAPVDEPAHWRAAGLRADFGTDPRFRLLEHRDDEVARLRHPAHAPVAPTVLALHTVLPAGPGGRRRLLLERHGSLPADEVRALVDGFGFDLAVGPLARHRLPRRDYAAVGA